MQPVDVLRHDAVDKPATLRWHQHSRRSKSAHLHLQRNESHVRECWLRKLKRSALGCSCSTGFCSPHAARPPEIRDTGRCADARSREHNHWLPQPLLSAPTLALLQNLGDGCCGGSDEMRRVALLLQVDRPLRLRVSARGALGEGCSWRHLVRMLFQAGIIVARHARAVYFVPAQRALKPPRSRPRTGRQRAQGRWECFFLLEKNTTDHCNTRGRRWQSQETALACQRAAPLGVCEDLHAEITSAQAARPRYAALCC